MNPPKWFYIVIAGCAVALTASEIAYRIHSWNHWEITSREDVFNPATGTECVLSADSLHVCYDLVNGRVLDQHKLVPHYSPDNPFAPKK